MRKWQASLLAKGYSQTYLRKIHTELTAIFNYAMKHYDLKKNPCRQAGSIGKKHADEMQFWTLEEYQRFSYAIMDKPVAFFAYQMLFWGGLRIGELTALTVQDFSFSKRTVTISKSLQRIERKNVITEPKTPKGKRIIALPQFLCEEMQEYINMLYNAEPTDRIFQITKSFLHHEMDRGSKKSGVKRIRVHDLRHSHVSHLIQLGFNAVEIADRLGHSGIDITLRYAHMFPTKQVEMAERLNKEGIIDV